MIASGCTCGCLDVGEARRQDIVGRWKQTETGKETSATKGGVGVTSEAATEQKRKWGEAVFEEDFALCKEMCRSVRMILASALSSQA